jgi:hypothetical protein
MRLAAGPASTLLAETAEEAVLAPAESGDWPMKGGLADPNAVPMASADGALRPGCHRACGGTIADAGRPAGRRDGLILLRPFQGGSEAGKGTMIRPFPMAGGIRPPFPGKAGDLLADAGILRRRGLRGPEAWMRSLGEPGTSRQQRAGQARWPRAIRPAPRRRRGWISHCWRWACGVLRLDLLPRDRQALRSGFAAYAVTDWLCPATTADALIAL